MIDWPTTIAATLAFASLAFYVANFIALRHWRRQERPETTFAPRVSILKPLKGCDEEMYAAFVSHCQQQYGEYEVLFGVNTADDPAVEYVERLKREFPSVPISLIVCTEALGANRKAANLAVLAGRARYRHLVVNDSDIRVPSDYLARIAPWFGAPSVGMVTCLYRPGRASTLWSKLEALGIVADFMPGALTARWLDRRVRFGLGSTMAFDRDALDKFGGFQAVADFLADDFELACRVEGAGYRIVVPEVIVETALAPYGFREFWNHQLRWGRTVRASRLGGYLGLVVTFGFFWALLALILSGGEPWAWALLLVVTAARVFLVERYTRALGDLRTGEHSWLLPLRDLLSPAIWLLSVLGNDIVWRGERFRLAKGRLQRRPAESAASSATSN